jgi:hypothetical protein
MRMDDVGSSLSFRAVQHLIPMADFGDEQTLPLSYGS